jgi:hypothetical protein
MALGQKTGFGRLHEVSRRWERYVIAPETWVWHHIKHMEN